MFVDTKLIDWLLENRTQYFISKETGIAQSKLSEIKNKKIDISNVTIKIGSKLTALAIREKNTASSE